jgi:type I restriction enzyme S subunit
MSSGSSEVVGKTARLNHSFSGSVGAFCGIVRTKSPETASYISHWFLSKEFLQWRDAQARGANIQNLSFSAFSSIPIPLPNPDEQKRIAAILDKADRLRRQRRFAQTLSDSFLQSVFIKMFGDPVSNPMNWNVSLLGKACVPKDGIKAGPFGSSIKKDSYSETGIRVYGQEQVIVDNYRIGNYRISEKKFQEMKAYAVQPDDVLISLVGTFGKVSIVPKDAELGIINPRLIRMRLNQEKLKSIFFREIFRNNSFLRKMQIMSHGGTMGILNGAQLKEIEIILPPLPLQEKFAEIVQKFERVRRQQREATRQAEHLFQTLLHRAFRGEL